MCTIKFLIELNIIYTLHIDNKDLNNNSEKNASKHLRPTTFIFGELSVIVKVMHSLCLLLAACGAI